MGQTLRRYPVREVSILTQNFAPHTGGTHHRGLEGAITAVVPPRAYMGRKEGTRFLRVLVSGWEENDYAQLVVLGTEAKRRYMIPLHRLTHFLPTFDLTRARDPLDWYQPFIHYSPEFPHERLGAEPPIPIRGLVFDTTIGVYL